MSNFYRHHPYLSVFLVFCIIGLFFFQGAFSGDFHVRDAYHEYFPQKLLWGYAHGGEFALWNPYTSMGVPVAGAGVNAVWYPANLVLFGWLRLPADYALRIYIVLHYILAGPGMFFFMRRLGVKDAGAAVGAVGYTLSGYAVSMHYAVNVLGTIAFLPLCAGLALKGKAEGRIGWWVLSGLAAALIFLAGDPQGFATALGLCALLTMALPREEAEAGAGQSAGTGSGTGAGRLLLGLAALAGAAFAGSAAEMLPMRGVLQASIRGSGGFDYQAATVWSFHPLRIIEFCLVRPFGEHWPVNRYWGHFLGETLYFSPMCVSPYAGVWVLVAAAAAGLTLRGRMDRRVLIMAGLLAVFLLISFGRFFPLYKFLFQYLPGLRSLRYPEKHLLMVNFSLAVLAGLGTEYLRASARPGGGPAAGTARDKGRGRTLATAGAALLAAAALGTVGWATRGRLGALVMPLLEINDVFERVGPEEAVDSVVFALTRSAVLLSLSLLTIAVLRRRGRGVWAALPALLVFCDLWRANTPLAPTIAGLCRQESFFALAILDRERIACNNYLPNRDRRLTLPCCSGPDFKFCAPPGRFRIFHESANQPSAEIFGFHHGKLAVTTEALRRWQRNTLWPNLGMVEGFEEFYGFNVATPRRFHQAVKDLITLDHLPVFNVKYAVIADAKAPADGPYLRTVLRYQGVSLLEFKEVFPRAYWIQEAEIAHSEAEADAMFPRVDFRKTALIELGPEEAAPDEKRPKEETEVFVLTPAEVVEYAPNQIKLRVVAPAPGWLILNDAYFAGWTATVDGEPAPIARANLLVRGVPVSAGKRAVEFRFQPPGLKTGLAASASAFFAGLIILAVQAGRKMRQS